MRTPFTRDAIPSKSAHSYISAEIRFKYQTKCHINVHTCKWAGSKHVNLVAKSLKLFILTILMAATAQSALALSIKGGPLTMDKLTGNSDDIVIAQVKTKSVKPVGRHIETDYEIEISESLKGKTYGPGKRVTLTLVGGDLTTPPLSQYTQGVPRMYVGEDVALFLTNKPPVDKAGRPLKGEPKSKLMTTPRIVGGTQGKFSIITDKSDGSRKVTRLDTERYQMIPQDFLLKQTIELAAAKRLRVTSGTIVGKGSAFGERDSLEQRSTGNAASFDRSGDASRLASSIDLAGGLVVQDLTDFKNQVTTQVSKETGR